MKKRRWMIAVAAAIALVAGGTAALAAHTGGDVTLKDASGNPITDATTPYSPKQTCGVCHNYGSGDKISTHTQGVIASDGKIYWQTYEVKSYEHGVSVNRHSNQGRNEDYSTAMRTAFGDPFFTSSPGMFGKY